MNWSGLALAISAELNEPFHIQTAHAVSGGDIHQAYQLHTSSGNVFLKINQASLSPLFATEAHNLNAIAASQSIRCPKVLATGSFEHYAWLLMEFLPLTSEGDDFQRGRDLALMHHQINRDPQPFGWFEDNFIGHSKQTNTWHSDWISFYGNARLRPQLELAQLNNAPNELFEKGLTLIDALPHWFQTYTPEPSLLHGDLWGGNSAFTTDGDPVLFDPASYYGDRETDIAMTELFGGFSNAFYAGYNDVFPLDSGYKQRKRLYNLYHILNHYNLFGGHYAQHALNTIQALLDEAS